METETNNLTNEELEIIKNNEYKIYESKNKLEFIFNLMNSSECDLFKGCIAFINTKNTFLGNIEYICIQRPCKYNK